MASNVSYMVDSRGARTSAVVPIKTWEKLNSDMKKLKAKMEILTGLRDALDEVKQSKGSSIKLKSLTEFLDEC